MLMVSTMKMRCVRLTACYLKCIVSPIKPVTCTYSFAQETPARLSPFHLCNNVVMWGLGLTHVLQALDVYISLDLLPLLEKSRICQPL